ncbi:MAG: DUF1343 domain-containing protein [Acidobacteriota bacterium]
MGLEMPAFKIAMLQALLAVCFTTSGTVAQDPVQSGADRILENPYLSWIQGKRVGLITNPTGVTSTLNSTWDLLSQHPDVDLKALFGPEHGIFGQAQAGDHVSDSGKVYSLYGETRAPTAEMLEGVEVLIYDIQDVGVRFYTYISTMYLSMQAAAKHGIPFIVLDRPNPIDGSRVEGPILQTEKKSFLGLVGLPIRYGMTPGELARMLNGETNLGSDLKVVPLSGWHRQDWYDQTALEWVLPSPNMPTLTTATLYPGLGLIEGTNLSEGRGTSLPFELVGAPWLSGQELAKRLNRLPLAGVRFRFQTFTPTTSKYQGEPCQGVQIHILDRTTFQPLEVALHLLQEVQMLHPEQFQWNTTFLDRLVGNSWVREALSEGRPVDEIVNRWQQELKEFKEVRKRYLLYR